MNISYEYIIIIHMANEYIYMHMANEYIIAIHMANEYIIHSNTYGQ